VIPDEDMAAIFFLSVEEGHWVVCQLEFARPGPSPKPSSKKMMQWWALLIVIYCDHGNWDGNIQWL